MKLAGRKRSRIEPDLLRSDGRLQFIQRLFDGVGDFDGVRAVLAADVDHDAVLAHDGGIADLGFRAVGDEGNILHANAAAVLRGQRPLRPALPA